MSNGIIKIKVTSSSTFSPIAFVYATERQAMIQIVAIQPSDMGKLLFETCLLQLLVQTIPAQFSYALELLSSSYKNPTNLEPKPCSSF
jgi:hypothetical protein